MNPGIALKELEYIFTINVLFTSFPLKLAHWFSLDFCSPDICMLSHNPSECELMWKRGSLQVELIKMRSYRNGVSPSAIGLVPSHKGIFGHRNRNVGRQPCEDWGELLPAKELPGTRSMAWNRSSLLSSERTWPCHCLNLGCLPSKTAEQTSVV